MKRYRMKEIVEAKRWFAIEDVPEAIVELHNQQTDKNCMICNQIIANHGKIILPDKSYDLVCPGDWILKYSNGKYIPCDHDTFINMYEEFLD